MTTLTLVSALGCRRDPPRPDQSGGADDPTPTLRTARPLPERHVHVLGDPLGGSAPGLTRGVDGLQLAWIRDIGEPTLLLAGLADGEPRWTEATVVTASPRLVVNWADVPAVGETRSGRVVVAWPELHTDDPSAGYGVRVAAANDDGSFTADRQWSPDEVRRGPESGFASFVDSPAGLRLIWLDGRELGGHSGHGAGGHAAAGAGTMQLRTVLIDDDGQQAGPSEILDPRTCECCKLGAAALGEQVFAAYRDRSDAEVRDVYVAGPGLAPIEVAADGWTLTGCPVNGPAAAAGGGRAWVAWYTGADDRAATWVANSEALADGFGPGQRFDLGLPGGRVELLALADGGALINWLELDPANPGLAGLMTRRLGADGKLGEPWFVAELGGARDWGFPRAALRSDPDGRDEVVWIWTDPTAADGRPRLQAVAAPLPPS